jgi:hypothetical protein
MEPAKGNAPPICDRCENEMQRIGKLPKVGLHPASQNFRCFGCNLVASEAIPSS